MQRTLIQQYATAIISGFYEKVKSLSRLDHKLTKGELIELFVTEVLSLFLTEQFGIGTGIIINQAGKQSNQNDIIIYDKRILPPFIKQKNIGVYPVESVLGVIEVKSKLTKTAITETENKFMYLRNNICSREYNLYKKDEFKPLCGLIGFYGIGSNEIRDPNGVNWLNKNINNQFSICLVGKYTWLKSKIKDWSICYHDPKTFEETKRFLAVFLDNIRTMSNKKPYALSEEHKDWLSIYIRDQELISKMLNKDN
ncbi:MAG: hypothetical protein JXB49_37370 [Bacteroidales bacterium]|nr:hypothetical protein [Bacteroidales bacterium]